MKCSPLKLMIKDLREFIVTAWGIFITMLAIGGVIIITAVLITLSSCAIAYILGDRSELAIVGFNIIPYPIIALVIYFMRKWYVNAKNRCSINT